MYDFAGKTAVVTGAAGGMGLQIARDLAAAGASVTGIDLQPRPDGFAAWIQGDVGDEATVARAGSSSTRFPYSFVERYAEAYQAELDHFADMLDGKVKASTGPRDSLRALRLADAAGRSLETGQPVSIGGEFSRA